MATYKQVVDFDVKKMGTTPNMCLRNVRLGYGLPGKYADAKEDMNANKKAKTFHADKNVPKNCSVPVYADTTSQYEHIMVSVKGQLYSDGKKTAWNKWKIFGWGEMCEGVKVIAKKSEPTPTPAIKIGDKVVPKLFADYNGSPLIRTRAYYFVSAINGDKVLLRADNYKTGVVYANVKKSNLKEVK